MKKTQDHKEFEDFIRKSEDGCFDFTSPHWQIRNKAGRYRDRFLQFGFECWMASKQIQQDHARG